MGSEKRMDVTGSIGEILKEAQRLQAEVTRAQEEMARRTVEGMAGGGMVRVTVDGRGRLRAVRIDPGAVDPADLPMLEDLIVAAVNSALEKLQCMQREEMERITGGLSLPGLGL